MHGSVSALSAIKRLNSQMILAVPHVNAHSSIRHWQAVPLSRVRFRSSPAPGPFLVQARDGGTLAVDCNDAGVQFRTAVLALSPLPR